MSLYSLDELTDLSAPALLLAFDGWVDAGSAATTAAGKVAERAEVVGRFAPDLLYDYRARRPTLVILDGRPADLTWPELTIRRRRIGERDLFVIVGPEPDFRWRELCEAALELAKRLGVVEWITVGSIPAAVPHTRSVPILGTQSETGLLAEGVPPGPDGLLTVPAAAVSVIDHAIAAAGIPAVGYFAQIPHYVSGEYPLAAAELLRVLGRHLRYDLASSAVDDEARLLRTRLDAATAADDQTRSYVERMEAMVDEARRPAGDDLIAEIERFLREGGGGGERGGEERLGE